MNHVGFLVSMVPPACPTCGGGEIVAEALTASRAGGHHLLYCASCSKEFDVVITGEIVLRAAFKVLTLPPLKSFSNELGRAGKVLAAKAAEMEAK